MQSAVSIDRFRSPIAIRALNKFGAMFNGKVSRRLIPDGLMETAKRRVGLEHGNAARRQLWAFAQDGRLEDVIDLILRETVLGL